MVIFPRQTLPTTLFVVHVCVWQLPTEQGLSIKIYCNKNAYIPHCKACADHPDCQTPQVLL